MDGVKGGGEFCLVENSDSVRCWKERQQENIFVAIHLFNYSLGTGKE